MVGDTWSQTSSLVSNERQLVLQLLLTTLSGEEIQIVIDLQEFDRLDEFETAVLEQLPTIGGRSTFGSELAFVHKDTGEIRTQSGTLSETATASTLWSDKVSVKLNTKGN